MNMEMCIPALECMVGKLIHLYYLTQAYLALSRVLDMVCTNIVTKIQR